GARFPSGKEIAETQFAAAPDLGIAHIEPVGEYPCRIENPVPRGEVAPAQPRRNVKIGNAFGKDRIFRVEKACADRILKANGKGGHDGPFVPNTKFEIKGPVEIGRIPSPQSQDVLEELS